MQISNREKQLLVVVGLLVFVVAIYQFVYQPSVVYFNDTMARIDAEQIELARLETIMDEIEMLEVQIANDTKRIFEVLAALPPKANSEPDLVRHLHMMYAPFGGKNAISIEEPTVFTEFSSVNVRMTYASNHEAFRTLLKLLEDSEFKNRLNTLSIQIQPEVIQVIEAVEVVPDELQETVAVDILPADIQETIAVDIMTSFYFSNE